MDQSSHLLLNALQGKKVSRAPFWFMRQAGRYLPEYKKLRAQAPSFLDFCYNPDMACEATLQPIRRFGMDGAIIFSDILVIPDALGMKVWFEEGKGPHLTPVTNVETLAALQPKKEKLSHVYQAIAQTRAALPKETTLIGFAGAPWTLACYMINGKGDRDFQAVRLLAWRDVTFFAKLMEILVQAVADHAKEQIKSGAQIIQLFDSWSGVLSEDEFTRWVIEPTRLIVADIKSTYPHVPVIGFPRNAGSKYVDYAHATGVDAISVDGSVSLSWAHNALSGYHVQGNLDPVVLAEDKSAMLLQAKKIKAILGQNENKAFVFNLGHGILPHTPLDNVQALCDFLKIM